MQIKIPKGWRLLTKKVALVADFEDLCELEGIINNPKSELKKHSQNRFNYAYIGELNILLCRRKMQK